GVGDAGLGRGDDVRPRQDVELASARQVADVDPEGPGGLQDVDVQVVDPAVDHDVADVPLGRYGRIEEIVAGALFLASDPASYVTGHTLAVDGGFVGAGIIHPSIGAEALP
ncbi:MAG: SDR family oxidoreductase, partial [Rhizobiales bacterium]|nr:SDR family oxidoreductase [Hyphomicrobiales bacterium]